MPTSDADLGLYNISLFHASSKTREHLQIYAWEDRTRRYVKESPQNIRTRREGAPGPQKQVFGCQASFPMDPHTEPEVR